MDVRISPAVLSGTVRAIPSKSDAHRKLICAALSSSPLRIELRSSSDDIDATMRCLSALGARIEPLDGSVMVSPIGEPKPDPCLDCGESGSTLRFLLPVAAALCPRASFCGGGRLPDRPIVELMQAMRGHGVSFSSPKLPFSTDGHLEPGEFHLPGGVSSQYVTGLLLALPTLSADSSIVLDSPLESRAYTDMTVKALSEFGIRVRPQEDGWLVPGRQSFAAPKIVRTDGDWSNAAFFLCAGAIGAPVTVTGLDTESTQGDKAILGILRRLGAGVESDAGNVTASPGRLVGCEIDVREIPDLLPVLAVTAACAEGETVFTGAARLRLKESDRLAATASMLASLGADVIELSDGLRVRGGALLGGTVDGCGDHRMVMAAAVAAIRCASGMVITGAEAAGKSYPKFFDDYNSLGGAANAV